MKKKTGSIRTPLRIEFLRRPLYGAIVNLPATRPKINKPN
jgi:hypothetical protein